MSALNKTTHTKRALNQDQYNEARLKGRQTGECISFLGPAMDSTDKPYMCQSCQGLTCARCGFALETRSQQHTCDPANLVKTPDTDRWLVRGQDYQICPNDKCEKIWGRDPRGCNAIICERCVSDLPGLSRK